MPYVLVAAAILWPNAVRLCRRFREVGFEVGAIALPQHPVHRSKAPDRTFDYRPKAPLDSLREAIAERRPDIIVPCDDRIVRHLCALRALGDDDTSTLIETSLGLGGASGVLAKRATLGEMSRLPNVDVPRTDSILSVSDLRTWVRRFGLPAILKLDGSWGGNDGNMGFPAILKGFIDKVFLPGVSFTLGEDGSYNPCLHNIKRLGVVCTYGGGRWLTFMMGDPPRRFLTRSMRRICAPGARCDYLAHHDMNHSTPERRLAFFRTIEARFSNW